MVTPVHSRFRASALLLVVACTSGCIKRVPPLPAAFPEAQRIEAGELVRSVRVVAHGRGNLDRQHRVELVARDLGLEPRTERIDLYSLQQNVVIDLPGRRDDLVYLVAHYDKTDSNPLTLVSTLLNGALDPLVGLTVTSSGAVDNATGVATVLQLGAWLARQPDRELSYRLLLAGAEEVGLRGSRAHVARIGAEERDRILLAVNVDAVGSTRSPDCAIATASPPEINDWLVRSASEAGHPLGLGEMSSFFTSDHESFRKSGACHELATSFAFNMLGVLLPQRSWFTTRHRAPVVAVSACDYRFGLGELGSFLALPTGAFHGARDNLSMVDSVRLHDTYAALRSFLSELETGDYTERLRAIDAELDARPRRSSGHESSSTE